MHLKLSSAKMTTILSRGDELIESKSRTTQWISLMFAWVHTSKKLFNGNIWVLVIVNLPQSCTMIIIYASVNHVTIYLILTGRLLGLQAIIWTNGGILLIRSLETNSIEIWIRWLMASNWTAVCEPSISEVYTQNKNYEGKIWALLLLLCLLFYTRDRQIRLTKGLCAHCPTCLIGPDQVRHFITMTLSWSRWRVKSPTSRLFTQPFIRAQIKENIKAPRHCPCAGNSPGTGESYK